MTAFWGSCGRLAWRGPEVDSDQTHQHLSPGWVTRWPVRLLTPGRPLGLRRRRLRLVVMAAVFPSHLGLWEGGWREAVGLARSRHLLFHTGSSCAARDPPRREETRPGLVGRRPGPNSSAPLASVSSFD